MHSGNFLAQAEVDNYNVLWVMLGIHPFGFQWKLELNAEFVTPEAVMVYVQLHGLFHKFVCFCKLMVTSHKYNFNRQDKR